MTSPSTPATADAAPACKPLRADAQRNRDRIVTAARAAVGEAGGEITLEDVARRAGVGIGTLYRHFPTRNDLLETVFLDEANELIARGRALEDADDPMAAMETYLRAHMEFGSRGHCLGSAVMAAKKTEGTPLNAASNELRAVGAGLLARAKAAGVARADVEIVDVMRLVHGINMVNAAAPDPAQQARMFDLVIAGIRR